MILAKKRGSHRWLLFVLVISALMASCVSVVPADEVAGKTSTPDEGAVESTQDENPPGSMMQWNTPPEMTIDPEVIYLATFKTVRGDIKVELFADRTPVTVNSFVFLAKEGYYDNTTFHRVLPDFMAQGGDPTGSGSGGPGYQFEDEFDPGLLFEEAGYLAMANSGPGTNGSQFFITFAPVAYLNGLHTIFGKVVEGMEVALSLTLRDPAEGPDYLGDLLITIEIEEQQRTDVLMTVDGQLIFPLVIGDRVRIERSEARARIVSAPRRSFYEVLRNKLKWSGEPGEG